MKNQLLKRISFVVLAGLLTLSGTSCSKNNNNGTQSGVGSQLVVDTVSPVPLVNGVPASYSVYVKNIGTTEVKGLSFAIADASSVKVIKSGASLKDTTTPAIDAGNCKTIAVNSSCKINIITGSIGTLELNGMLDGKTVLSFSTSTYPMTVTNSGDLSNALVLGNYPSTMVLQPNPSIPGSYFGAMSLSVVNQYNGAIDVSNLFGNLPTNVTWSLINCPNPLPFGGVCQVRLTYNGPMSGNVTANLRPSGSYNGTTLPEQSSRGSIFTTKSRIASLNVSYPSMSLDGNNPTSNNTIIGYITNNGTNPANISGVRLNDGNGGFSISDNKCVGQLGANSSCQYTITADVSKLSSLSSGTYTTGIYVTYNNGMANTQASGQLSYSYTTSIAPANVSIGITAPSVLNQTILSSSVTITNKSNVVIDNLTMPTLSGATSHVSLSDPNSCSTKTIGVNGSCSYTLTFNPQAPSETDTVTISGVSANYTDPISGIVKQISFSNTTSVNLNSQFAGLLSLSGTSSLNATTPSGTITVTNTGNYNATLSNIAITSSGTNNIQKIGGTCANQTLATNRTCTIIVGITNTSLANSGASSIVVTYNNHNGTTNATASSDVNWVIGSVPSLAVTFSTNTLSAVVNQTVETILTLTNNGNTVLSNIQLPILTQLASPLNTVLRYQTASSNACSLSGQQLSNQSLAAGSSCNVVLEYAPTTAFTSQSVALGIFSGIHSGNQSYTSNSYGITLSATSASQIIFTANGSIVTSLNPSLNWTNNTSYSQSVVLKNTGASPITSMSISATSDGSGTLSVSGCANTLVVGGQCTLTITGNYPPQTNIFTSNGSINFIYSDAGNSHSATISINATVAMMPVVTPGLGISGVMPSTIYAGEGQIVQLTLTNNTTATNSGNGALVVNMDSLTQNIGTNLTGSLNTTGITTNACSAVSGSITLNANQSCVVNLELAASTAGSMTATITPQYQYYAYSGTNVIPNHTAATGLQLSTLSGGITVQDRSASLSLGWYSNNTYTTAITGLSVEQGLINPTATLKVTNTGTTALTGITMPTISGFTFTPDGSCTTLAIGSSCNIGVTLNSANVIAQTDITTTPANLISYTYSNNQGSYNSSSDLPSLNYQVSAPNAPSINVSSSISGCGTGSTTTGSTQTCNLNPGTADSQGIAGGYKFIVTYTNSGSGVANAFTVAPATLGNYAAATNNCNGVTLAANTGSCTVTYALSNPATATSGNVSNGASVGTYSYTYGSQNQLSSGSVSATNPNQVTLNIQQRSLSLGLSPSSIQINGTSTVTGTISNWYSPSIPSLLTITSSDTGKASNISASCTSSGSGAVCTGTLTGLAAGTTNLSASITMPDGSSIAGTSSPSPLVLTVVPPAYFVAYYPTIAHPAPGGTTTDCVVNNTGAGITGTCECIEDPNTNKIWTAVGPNNTATSGTWNNWTGGSLTTYNATDHCGLTGDWHLPSAPNANLNYMSSSNPGGDWGDIAIAAGMNGNNYAIGTWMNNNGFQNINTNSFYWSSQSYSIGSAWFVQMVSGTVEDGDGEHANLGVLLVHP